MITAGPSRVESEDFGRRLPTRNIFCLNDQTNIANFYSNVEIWKIRVQPASFIFKRPAIYVSPLRRRWSLQSHSVTILHRKVILIAVMLLLNGMHYFVMY